MCPNRKTYDFCDVRPRRTLRFASMIQMALGDTTLGLCYPDVGPINPSLTTGYFGLVIARLVTLPAWDPQVDDTEYVRND